MTDRTKQLLRYLITILVGMAIACAMIFGRGILSAADDETIYKLLCDGFFVPGILITCFGLLVLAGNGGTYDMLSYGLNAFFSLFTRGGKSKYSSFYEYREEMKSKARSFVYLVVVGGAFVLLSVVMLVIYSTVV